jgi:hypothetical protein
MDPANISWLDSNPDDEYWEAHYRRINSEGDRESDSPSIPADFDDNEDAWNDIRRRERVAQAMYDC